jgi:hypothetical protein
VSSDEPEYLKAMRRAQEAKKSGNAPKEQAATKAGAQTPAEREAIRWGKEVGGKEINIPGPSAGAKCAILIHPITPFGTPRISLEWIADREALAARIHQAQGAGENVVGCFELTTGRSLTPETVEGKLTFVAGQPRQIPKAESPERMIRKAAAQAAQLAKTRKTENLFGGHGGKGTQGGHGGRGGARGR